MKNLKRAALISFILAFAVSFFLAYNYYFKIFGANVKQESSVYIKSSASFDDVLKELTPHLESVDDFKWVAKKKNYPNVIKGGHYIIKKGMNNNELVNLLRSGQQTPIKLAFNNQDTVEKLAGRISQQIEADSTALVASIFDKEFLQKNNLNKADVLQIFIPNSYEFYWNTSADKFRNKMLKEYHRFWNDSRKAKAKKLGLTPSEVSTLASIVQKETAQASERPLVAGLYLNRLRDKWPLQADPTVIFSMKQKYGQDLVIKRVLNKDLTIDSPYNTYQNVGLPPAPIAMPDISAIDGVLNRANHDYYYMCASVDKIGFHEFAKTIEQHNRNAVKYQKWISKQGINR